MFTTIPPFIPKNDDADQVCIFINDAADLNFLCLGKVGRSLQFCLAHKDPPLSCTVVWRHMQRSSGQIQGHSMFLGGLCLVTSNSKNEPMYSQEQHFNPHASIIHYGNVSSTQVGTSLSEATAYKNNDEETKSRVGSK
jgi:hypothetical protein